MRAFITTQRIKKAAVDGVDRKLRVVIHGSINFNDGIFSIKYNPSLYFISGENPSVNSAKTFAEQIDVWIYLNKNVR